jgi:hypothetical protein
MKLTIVFSVIAILAGGCDRSDPSTIGGGGAAPTGGVGGLGRMGGTGATSGTGRGTGGGAVEGILATCPQSTPTGSCAVAGLTCEYPTETCVCGSGRWRCTACPMVRPTSSDSIRTPASSCDATAPSFSCLYGSVTCSCPGNQSQPWGCGVCPSAHPTPGQACGNTRFRCQYGYESCSCTEVQGSGVSSWYCDAPAACPAPTLSNVPAECWGAAHTCEYPSLDQACTCTPSFSTITCSCPTVAPPEGRPCVDFLTTCTYGDQMSQCFDGSWHWCPKAQPVNGSACSLALTCPYGDTFCFCFDNSWSCF